MRNVVVLAWTVIGSLIEYRRTAGTQATAVQRADWMHKWCATALRRLRIEVCVIGRLPEAGLIVSNHLSYLDIFAIGTAMRCLFVSRADVRNWPVFGTLTTIAGTVYIDRTRRSDTRNANDAIRRALEQGLRVVVFPEGTSSSGAGVLPFYPSLFESAIECNAPITAAHISYSVEQGSVGRDIAYWGEMTFVPHLLKLLSKRGVSATVTFAAHSRKFANRKQAAAAMREEVLQLHEACDPVTVTS